jgi:probable F420-dependent oxidoreductase
MRRIRSRTVSVGAMENLNDIGTYGVWASHLGLFPRDTAREQARAMEQLGYGCLWVGEAEGKEALTHAAFLLAATDEVVVATGIANIWGRDARAMWNGARTLCEAWPRRFLLGIGASHAPLVEDRGRAYGKPFTEMQRYLDALGSNPWRGPELPGEPPLVLAALGPKMLELAAERSDGVHTFLVTPEHTRRAREAVGPEKLVAPEQAIVVGASSREEARESAERHLQGYLRLPNYRRNLERLGWDESHFDEGASDELFDALIAWGDAETVAERLRAHVDAGADHVAVHPLVPDAEVLPVPQLEELAPLLPSH